MGDLPHDDGTLAHQGHTEGERAVTILALRAPGRDQPVKPTSWWQTCARSNNIAEQHMPSAGDRTGACINPWHPTTLECVPQLRQGDSMISLLAVPSRQGVAGIAFCLGSISSAFGQMRVALALHLAAGPLTGKI